MRKSLLVLALLLWVLPVTLALRTASLALGVILFTGARLGRIKSRREAHN